MSFSDKRYEAQYAADMKFFACVDMVETELRIAIEENGFNFADMSDREVAKDLHRYSAAAELWDFDVVLASVPVAMRNINVGK